jgi:oligopeptidase A
MVVNDGNPLLQIDALPAFDRIRADHIGPAVDHLLADAYAALARSSGPEVPADFDAMSAAYAVVTERLDRVWSAVAHLSEVADSPAWRAAYNAALPKVVAFYTREACDERLFAKYKAVAAGGGPTLSPTRMKVLSNWLRDFVLSGADLRGEAKQRFARIQERCAELSQKFAENVMDATDGYAYFASDDEAAGLPPDVAQAARAAAAAQGRSGVKLTLHGPTYVPAMQSLHSRELRKRLYTAYVTRASELGDAALDNSALMQELLALRFEEARLLGFASYADLSLVPKMADSPTEVTRFLRDLAERARPHAQADVDELRRFAASELGLPDLQAWDMAYASERLKEQRFSFSEQEVKAYFTEPHVLRGLFGIIETLFDVRIAPDEAPVWHPSVHFYRIERSGELIGQFYLDAYARPGKGPGAWMDDARKRWRRPEGGLQTPVAFIVCNHASPVGEAPALLTHDDVLTLFHEFGHGLHHMLTRVEEIGVSGISGVEWDAVELPSQFMENFCWEWAVMSRLTAHVRTGEPMPRELFDKMVAARNFQSGLQTMRQVEMALFDMRIHSEPDAAGRLQAVLDDVRREVCVLSPPPFNRFQHSFGHIFSGEYGAGYYSYKWAEVLSADAWSAFEERGVLDADTGRRYREQILEAGGSRSALESFTAFRGRAPTIDALLRHQGMA